MIALEQGDTVLVKCPDCNGDGRYRPFGTVDIGPCPFCCGAAEIEAELAEAIDIDGQAVSEQLAQQRGGA